jgi:anti-sigma regulatory factor (Ser/Thr protein kinase)
VDVHVQLTDSADARGFVRERLRGYSDEIVQMAELLTTELVTNALVHGAYDPIVSIEADGDRVRVEVYDSDPNVDLTPQWGDPRRTSGRGLAIVEALATSWGVEEKWNGKIVWFDLVLKAGSMVNT